MEDVGLGPVCRVQMAVLCVLCDWLELHRNHSWGHAPVISGLFPDVDSGMFRRPLLHG